VEKLNAQLIDELPWPIRFGIGIHAGIAIVGDIGHEEYAAFTVIGDPVNVAARLQDLTKPLGCEVLMSEEVTLKRASRPTTCRGASPSSCATTLWTRSSAHPFHNQTFLREAQP